MSDRDEGGPARAARLPESLTYPGTVVYEPAAVGDTALVPYEKADRTPAALQHLETMTSGILGIAPHWFVSLRGAVLDGGSVALFGEVRQPGQGPDFRLYRVVSYDGGSQKFSHASRIDRADAEHLYDQRVQELS